VRARSAANNHFNGTFENITFKKSGAEIFDRIKSFVGTLESEDLSKLRGELETICKDREVNVTEVLEAGDDHDAHMEYSSKYMSAPGAPRGQGQIAALETDLNRIRKLVFNVTFLERRIENLKRIGTNIDKKDEFKLSYAELVELGF